MSRRGGHERGAGNRGESAGDKFAIIIPARNESAVIEGLFESIGAQTMTVPFSDVYVVVERADDPTVRICERYGAKVIVRRKLEGRRRKGYALAEAVEEILGSGAKYGAYLILDADNRLDKNFVERMWKLYEKGYDIGLGRRRTLNLDTAVAVGSGLIFAITGRMRIISGTGFYIAGRVVEGLGTYPFHSLTEDYELSVYAVAHGLKVGSAKGAVFYDEQPRRYRDYFRQRTRWVKGYFEARRNFRGQLWRLLRPGQPNFWAVLRKIVGVYDLAALVILIIVGAVWIVISGELVILNLVGLLLGVYIILAVVTWYLLVLEKYKLSFWMRLKVILLNPLLLASYVPCLIAGMLEPELEWKEIRHGE